MKAVDPLGHPGCFDCQGAAHHVLPLRSARPEMLLGVGFGAAELHNSANCRPEQKLNLREAMVRLSRSIPTLFHYGLGGTLSLASSEWALSFPRKSTAATE
jgi:hypothetical protein